MFTDDIDSPSLGRIVDRHQRIVDYLNTTQESLTENQITHSAVMISIAIEMDSIRAEIRALQSRGNPHTPDAMETR